MPQVTKKQASDEIRVGLKGMRYHLGMLTASDSQGKRYWNSAHYMREAIMWQRFVRKMAVIKDRSV